MEQIKITVDSAQTIYISSPNTSYGIFCYNSHGDLFLNSDWGMFGFAWRAFTGSFLDFLKQLNAEYMACKFAINWNNCNTKQMKFSGNREKAVTELCRMFIEYLNKDQNVQGSDTTESDQGTNVGNKK